MRSSRSWRTPRPGTSPTGPSSASRPSARRPATRATRFYATDGTADWLLWRIPDLRGRIAYDVRFELYDQKALDGIVQYGSRRGDWTSLVDGYRVVVVDDRAHLQPFRTEPGSRIVYHDDAVAIVDRTAPSP